MFIAAFGKSPGDGKAQRVSSLMVRTDDVVNGNLWRSLPCINVDRMADIPADYPGPIGVPISIMDKFNPDQFAIVTQLSHGSVGPNRPDLYRRIVIRHLHPELPEEIDIAALLATFGIATEVSHEPPPDQATTAYRRCISHDPPMTDGRRFARTHRKE